MTIFYPPALCAEVEGLLCLSDLPNLEQQLLCSSEDPCLHFFEGMGFRPAVRAIERDQYGDRMILIVSDDEAYYAKYDMPFDATAFLPLEGALLPLPVAPTQPLLATPGGAPATYVSGGSPGFGGFPGFGGGSGSGSGDGPGSGPTAPDQPDTGTPPSGSIPGGGTPIGGGGGGTEQLPPLTPIPLSGSGLFLVLALAMIILTAARRLPRVT